MPFADVWSRGQTWFVSSLHAQLRPSAQPPHTTPRPFLEQVRPVTALGPLHLPSLHLWCSPPGLGMLTPSLTACPKRHCPTRLPSHESRGLTCGVRCCGSSIQESTWQVGAAKWRDRCQRPSKRLGLQGGAGRGAGPPGPLGVLGLPTVWSRASASARWGQSPRPASKSLAVGL